MTTKYDHEIIHHDPSEGFDSTEPAASQITAFVVGSVIMLVVVIGALQFYFNSVWDNAVEEKVLSAPDGLLQDQRNLEAWRMNHYEYTTPAKDTIRLPFDRAKELFLQEQAQGRTFYPGVPTVPKPEEPEAPAAAPADGASPAAGGAGAPVEAAKQ